MLTDLISLHGDETVRQAIGLMLSEKIREIPVVDDQQHLVGTVRDDGLVSLAMPSYSEMLVDMSYVPDDFEPFERRLRTSADLPINSVMRQDYITVDEDTSVIEIAWLMLHHNQRRVFVLRNNVLVGTVGFKEIMPLMLRP
jgi:CBS domain-containing protein